MSILLMRITSKTPILSRQSSLGFIYLSWQAVKKLLYWTKEKPIICGAYVGVLLLIFTSCIYKLVFYTSIYAQFIYKLIFIFGLFIN